MKRNSVVALLVAILLVVPVALVIEGLFFPDFLGMTLVPLGVFGIVLWFNTYRTSKKRQAQAVDG
jgi:undecaprenyl pyrophosphate phosphatase UppP